MYCPDKSDTERIKRITPTQEQKIILAGGASLIGVQNGMIHPS